MTLLFVDSFDHYSDLEDKGWVATGPGFSSIDTGYGRYGTSGVGLTGTTGQRRTITKPITVPPEPVMTVGAGLLISGTTDQGLLSFGDDLVTKCLVQTDDAGRIKVLSTVSTKYLLKNRFYHLEARIEIGIPGYITVRVNGQVWLTMELDTIQGGRSWVDRVTFGGHGGGSGDWSYQVDDVYITNHLAPHNQGYLGDCRIYCLWPAVLQANDWVPSGADAVAAVNETVPDGDATFVGTYGVGDTETYHVDPVSGFGDPIKGVQVSAFSRKTGPGMRAYQTVVERTDFFTAVKTEAVGEEVAFADAYQFDPQVYERAPDGAEWDVHGLTDSVFGVRTTA